MGQREEGRSSGQSTAFRAAIEAAHGGAPAALGALFEECRDYLLLVANRELGETVRAKVAPSDLVQETFLQAQQIFNRFQGTTKDELLAWLKRIFELKLAQATRTFVATEMRASDREVPIRFIEEEIVRDLRRPEEHGASSVVELSEKRQRLRRALERLPADYRTAIEFRSLEQRPFAELGAALSRSPAAARMVWVRALAKLEEELRSS